MHSPLEIARNFVEIAFHKVKLSAWKMLILGFRRLFYRLCGSGFNHCLRYGGEPLCGKAFERLCLSCGNGYGAGGRQ